MNTKLKKVTREFLNQISSIKKYIILTEVLTHSSITVHCKYFTKKVKLIR